MRKLVLFIPVLILSLFILCPAFATNIEFNEEAYNKLNPSYKYVYKLVAKKSKKHLLPYLGLSEEIVLGKLGSENPPDERYEDGDHKFLFYNFFDDDECFQLQTLYFKKDKLVTIYFSHPSDDAKKKLRRSKIKEIFGEADQKNYSHLVYSTEVKGSKIGFDCQQKFGLHSFHGIWFGADLSLEDRIKWGGALMNSGYPPSTG